MIALVPLVSLKQNALASKEILEGVLLVAGAIRPPTPGWFRHGRYFVM
jgi:hypothetical protein